jgi:hypothetical protein
VPSLDRFLTALDEAVHNRNGDALACLGAYIELVHDPFSLGEDHALAWFGLWYEARSNSEVHAINRKFQVENLVSAAAHERGVDLEPWRVARGLISLSDGLWQELMIDRNAFGPEIAREIFTDFLARHFN